MTLFYTFCSILRFLHVAIAGSLIISQISLQMAELVSMFAAQNATSTSASIVIFTFMRACTIALVVRVNVVSHHS